MMNTVQRETVAGVGEDGEVIGFFQGVKTIAQEICLICRNQLVIAPVQNQSRGFPIRDLREDAK